jgi:hypothetical protein
MLPTNSRPISPIEAGRVSDRAASEISAATKEDSSPAFVACFVMPRKQAETLISVLQEYVSNPECFSPANFSTLSLTPT